MKTPIDNDCPGLLKRRDFLCSSVGIAVAGLTLPTALAQDLGQYQETGAATRRCLIRTPT